MRENIRTERFELWFKLRTNFTRIDTVLFLSKLEYNPGLGKVERRPFLQVLVDGVRVEA